MNSTDHTIVAAKNSSSKIHLFWRFSKHDSSVCSTYPRLDDIEGCMDEVEEVYDNKHLIAILEEPNICKICKKHLEKIKIS